MTTLTDTPRRILLVAYFYPPLNSIGSRRPYGLAKWLRRRGHDVTVLTSVQSGRGPDDAATRLVRARDLLATRLNWRGDGMAVTTGSKDALWDPSPTIWGSLCVPDLQLVSWTPFALAAARRLHRQHDYDVVITTSPVESGHAVGLALQRRGAAWIADMRDGWRFEAPRPEWPLRLQRALDGAAEAYAVKRADAVVIVSDPLADDLRRRHGIAVETLTNGFDPEDVAQVDGDAARDLVDGGKLTLVHTGGLGGERTLGPLLEGLVRIAREQPRLHERVELVLVGAQTKAERSLYAEPAYAPFVRHHGFVPRATSLALQRTADVLVLVTSGVRTGEATGKLYEYLATGRPILVLGAGSAAGQIVEDCGAGRAIPTHDADAAEAALRRLLDEGIPAPPPSARDRFAYPALAERYERVIERAIAARAGS